MIRDLLRRLRACNEAVEWAGGRKSLSAAWRACPQGDWLLWSAGKAGVDPKLIVKAACEVVRQMALPIWSKAYPDDTRPLNAMLTAEAWCRGKASIAEVREAADAAHAATYVAAEAAHAATEAADAAHAATEAAYAAEAATEAAYAAEAAYADTTMLAKITEIIRTVIPWATVRTAMRTSFGAMEEEEAR